MSPSTDVTSERPFSSFDKNGASDDNTNRSSTVPRFNQTSLQTHVSTFLGRQESGATAFTEIFKLNQS